jgi:hypothetical protein
MYLKVPSLMAVDVLGLAGSAGTTAFPTLSQIDLFNQIAVLQMSNTTFQL